MANIGADDGVFGSEVDGDWWIFVAGSGFESLLTTESFLFSFLCFC